MFPRIALMITAVLLLALTPAQASVTAKVHNTISLPDSPLAVALSPDSTWTFVLLPGGKLQIYNADGVLNDILTVDAKADSLSVTGDRGENLVVGSSAGKNVQLITLNFAARIDTTGAPMLGEESAPISLVIFSDFQCPFCAKIGASVEQILARYPGSVKVFYKHFPLRNHQFASLAALAAIAAQEQGKFWEFHDSLFAAQNEISQQKILAIAGEIGLDMKKFTADIGANPSKERLAKDIGDGKQAGVRGTPTVFINGRETDAPTLEAMQALIEAELAVVRQGQQQK
ncbi:MAG: thioredoxin domain-containing protein [Thermodesulfobacteriota bacterium]